MQYWMNNLYCFTQLYWTLFLFKSIWAHPQGVKRTKRSQGSITWCVFALIFSPNWTNFEKLHKIKKIYQKWLFRDGFSKQSHYREVPRLEIFMEQELRFRLDLGRLALLKKKICADYELHFRPAFSSFHGQKKF